MNFMIPLHYAVVDVHYHATTSQLSHPWISILPSMSSGVHLIWPRTMIAQIVCLPKPDRVSRPMQWLGEI